MDKEYQRISYSPKRLTKAFGYSMAGLLDTIKSEASFRLELYVALVLVPIALLVTPDAEERALLIFSVVFVLVVEVMNTAVEAVVDRVSMEHHPLSKKAKDAGSAAVFLSLVLAGAVWALILLG